MTYVETVGESQAFAEGNRSKVISHDQCDANSRKERHTVAMLKNRHGVLLTRSSSLHLRLVGSPNRQAAMSMPGLEKLLVLS